MNKISSNGLSLSTVIPAKAGIHTYAMCGSDGSRDRLRQVFLQPVATSVAPTCVAPTDDD